MSALINEYDPVPDWTLGERMGKALRTSGVGIVEMAQYLDVSRNSVSAWINDRTPPKRQTILLWAVRTGIPLHWLETGHVLGEMPQTCPECAARDSNPEPAGKGPRHLFVVA